jgi:hypothetical protein
MAQILAMEPGDTRIDPNPTRIHFMRKLVTIIHKKHPERRYQTEKAPDGARIWRRR